MTSSIRKHCNYVSDGFVELVEKQQANVTILFIHVPIRVIHAAADKFFYKKSIMEVCPTPSAFFGSIIIVAVSSFSLIYSRALTRITSS